MNRFSKTAMLAVGAFGLASAAGSLWGPNSDDFPSLQVKVPAAVTCWEENPTAEEGNPCYDETAGWWFGYTDKEATTQVQLSGAWTDFGEGVSISDAADGSSLIDGDGLHIKFIAGAAASSNAPAIAGIGFNFKKPEAGENIDSHGGYCITYTLTGEALQFELGWDEATYDYDTWYANLPTGSKKTVDLSWTGDPQSEKVAGDFKKDGWGTDIKSQTINTATQSAYSVKIRLKNGTTSGVNSEFVLHQLGWKGECDASPIVSGSKGLSSLSMSINGRSLSFNKAVSVQLVNLQGAVVASQSIAPSAAMNLSNLPTGVYMVRVPALGYTNKIMLK